MGSLTSPPKPFRFALAVSTRDPQSGSFVISGHLRGMITMGYRLYNVRGGNLAPLKILELLQFQVLEIFMVVHASTV